MEVFEKRGDPAAPSFMPDPARSYVMLIVKRGAVPLVEAGVDLSGKVSVPCCVQRAILARL